MDREERAESRTQAAGDLSAVAQFGPNNSPGAPRHCGAVSCPAEKPTPRALADLSLPPNRFDDLLDQSGGAPGFAERLLEAALGNDLDARPGERVIPGELLRVARDRRRLV